MKDLSKYLIQSNQTVREALEKLNSLSGGAITLFVIDENKELKGALTDGDIRRNLLKGKSINEFVKDFMNETPYFLKQNRFNLHDVQLIKRKKYMLIPIVNELNQLIQLIDFSAQKTLLPLHAIIMAGGKGVRLMPLTANQPKPLLPVGGKPILEHNIDRLSKFGIADVTISINYLGSKIQDYFKDGENKNLRISYIDEGEKQLGTLGSVSLVELKSDDVLIMNSDLLTNVDFEDMYTEFKEKDADMIVAAIPYEVKIPYAVLKTEDDQIKSFEEKPTYTYYSNAGIYMVKKEVLNKIPKGEFYNATDLIEELISSKQKVSYYPILGYWLDIGKHDDYKKAQEDIKHLIF